MLSVKLFYAILMQVKRIVYNLRYFEPAKHPGKPAAWLRGRTAGRLPACLPTAWATLRSTWSVPMQKPYSIRNNS